jgi:hypothetical protein
MTAIVSVTLITTGFPVGLTKPDGSNVVYVTAREPDAQRNWELWGISTTARTSIGKLGEGDTIEVRERSPSSSRPESLFFKSTLPSAR